MNTSFVLRSLLVACVVACAAARAEAQSVVSGTILGSGLGSSPGGRDSNWSIVALPPGFTPPSSQTVPYASYVPSTVDFVFIGGGAPQTGQVFGSGTNYWIAPQNSTNSLIGGTYNWITQQQFYVPVSGFYRFDFPGAGDNELEFYIDGAVNTTNPTRPTITGGQQIGGRAGNFTSISTFTGGAQLSSGTHTASMVLWDYGGSTGALIGTSTFAPAVAYWAPGSGAGGNGTWTNSNAYWTTDAAGLTTKQPWTNGVGVAYFGGASGTVSVGENVAVNQVYFTTGGYTVQSAGGQINYGNGGTITASTGTATISATQSVANNLKISGNGTVVLSGATTLGFGKELLVDGGKLLVNGSVDNGFGSVTVTAGFLGGTGAINSSVRGNGLLNPGLTGSASGILAATQLNPSDGLDLTFVFSGTSPNYGSASNSSNDVLRLTGNPQFTAPFAASLTSANTKTLFLNFTKEQLTVGGSNAITELRGGFFTDAQYDFTSSLYNARWDNAGFLVYVLGDGNGTDNSINGQGYYNWRNPAMFGWDQSLFMSTTPETASFAGGTVNGQVMLLSVAVPEPCTIVLLGVGAAGLGYARFQRRTRKSATHPTAASPTALGSGTTCTICER
jgi:hypothetical protein